MHAAECSGLPRSLRIAVGKDGRDSTRITTTISHRQKAELDRIAKREGVKTAWLARRAIERFIEQANGGALLPLDFEGGNA